MNNTCSQLAFLVKGLHDLQTDSTEIEAQLKEDLAASIVLASCLLVGSAFLLFAGARLVKPALFLAAFGAATVGSFASLNMILAQVPSLTETVSCVVLGMLPLALGLVAGLTALCLLNVGFALLGAGAGAGIGLAIFNAGLNTVHTPPIGPYDSMYVGCLLVGAVVGAIVMCRYQKEYLILCTSAAGASGATPAVALLLAHVDINFLHPAPGSPYAWGQPIFAVAAFALGLLVQCRHEKKHRAAKVVTADAEAGGGLRASRVLLLQP